MEKAGSVSSLKQGSPYIRIEPVNKWKLIDVKELWANRSLLLYLVWREIQGQYRSTSLGVFWVLLQPLATAAVLTVVMQIFVKVPTNGLPYVVVLFSGLSLWLYYASVVSRACQSMVGNSYLLSKVYFPRIIIPLVPLFVVLVDLSVLLIVTLILTLAYGIAPTVKWLIIPVVILLTVLLALGASLWLSSLNVKYRDIGNVLTIILQAGVFISPVYYLIDLVPAPFLWLYKLNPMVGVIESMRWAIFNFPVFPWDSFIISVLAGLLFLVSGMLIFTKIQDTIVDIV